MPRRDGNRLTRRSRLGGSDAVVTSENMQRRYGEDVGDGASRHDPFPLSRIIAAEQFFDQLLRSRKRQRLAFIGPILELDETLGLGTRGVQSPEVRELLDRA